MSKATQAGNTALQNSQSLKYGDYNVTKDWLYVQNPLLGQGGAGAAVINPNDTTQKFFLDDPNSGDAQQLQGFLSKPQGITDWGKYNESLNAQYLNNGVMDSTGRYSDAWAGTGNQTLSALAEQKRLSDVTAKVSSGQISSAQGDSMANDKTKVAGSGVPNVYQTAYDKANAMPASGTTPASRAANSKSNQNSNSTDKGIQMNYDKALSDIYGSRSDLQELYNPDGSAKNINDSRIAGIPTLQEWAKMYGGKEYPILQNATFGSANVPTTNVNVDAGASNNSSNLNNSKTSKDVESLLAANAKNREDYLSTLAPNATELELQKQVDDILTTTRNTELSALAGIQKESNRVVPMQAIIGAQKVIEDAANLKLQTLSAQADTINRKLQLEQTKRQALLDVYKTKLQFGHEDLQLAIDLAKAQKEENVAAMEFAAQNQITSPFFQVGSTIYRTSDRKAYETPEQFYKDAGVTSFADAAQKNLIQSEFGKATEVKHSTIYTEWQDYVNEQQKAGKPAMDFNTYQTMDANRKKSNVSVNMPSLVREYEYAQGQGFTGSLIDYTHAKSNTNTLPWE